MKRNSSHTKKVYDLQYQNKQVFFFKHTKSCLCVHNVKTGTWSFLSTRFFAFVWFTKSVKRRIPCLLYLIGCLPVFLFSWLGQPSGLGARLWPSPSCRCFLGYDSSVINEHSPPRPTFRISKWRAGVSIKLAEMGPYFLKPLQINTLLCLFNQTTDFRYLLFPVYWCSYHQSNPGSSVIENGSNSIQTFSTDSFPWEQSCC